MIVKVLEFGSSWWARFGRDPNDRYRFTKHAAYFNSSGLLCGSKMRRHWVISGLVRFNGVSDFNPSYRLRSVGRVFDCSDLNYACGGNRLLFRQKVDSRTVPDYYLVKTSSERFGVCDFHSENWKSVSARVIAASDMRNPSGQRQEALLLMPVDGWVRNAIGTWQLRMGPEFQNGAALQLEED
jgi:hypothetical protein